MVQTLFEIIINLQNQRATLTWVVVLVQQLWQNKLNDKNQEN